MATEVLRAFAMTNEIHLRPHSPSIASSSTPPSPTRLPPISPKARERPLPALPIPPKGLDFARTASPGPSIISARKLAKSPEAGPSRSRPHSRNHDRPSQLAQAAVPAVAATPPAEVEAAEVASQMKTHCKPGWTPSGGANSYTVHDDPRPNYVVLVYVIR